MGNELFKKSNAFRNTVNSVNQQVQKIDKSIDLVQFFTKIPLDTAIINDSFVGQMLLFAYQIALSDMYKQEFGIEPSAVVGYSIGEVASLYAANVLSLEHAV